jgi:molybdopterin converting factor small subunit
VWFVPGALIVEVRIRLGSGIARLAPAPMFVVELPVVRGAHVGLEQALAHGDEVALLVPVSGG